MCVGGSPDPAPVQEKREKPVFVRNPYLDDENKGNNANRVGRGMLSLAIPLAQSIGFEGRGGASSGTRGTSDGSLQIAPRVSDLAVTPYAGPAPRVGARALGPANRPAPKGHMRYQDPRTGQWGNLAVGNKKFTPDP
jgi:hypothetical protein